MKRGLLVLLGIFLPLWAVSAQVAINTSGSDPDGSAMLDVQSTTQGLLIPRMSVSDRDGISSPATGLTVYVTDDNSFYYYDGTSWIRLQQAGKSWLLAGNAGTSGAEFLGTTDAQPLIIKTNNTERVRIKDNGVIGINTTPDDNYLLYVSGNNHSYVGRFVSTRTSADDIGVYGEVTASDYYGIGGEFRGGWIGVRSYVYPTGSNYYYGIISEVNGGSGVNEGLDLYVNGTGTNYGVFSYTTGGNTNYSGYFYTSTPYDGGSAGFFVNSDNAGTGIYALGSNVSSYFINSDGAALVGTGKLLGIAGFSEEDDSNTICVLGDYEGTDNYADATGVQGYSYPRDYWGYGVKGIGGYYGVWGEDINGSAAVFANGDLDASGTKSFVIDHPLDPANKFLKHFSIESNEVLNVYRGNVTLDANGEATVQLPHYFHAVNRNFSYMLTPVGSPAPGLYVSREIDDQGTFKIAGGNPGQKISWYVYAERNDPYLQQHPEKRKVEVPKKAKERGKYLMPELYGQPDSKRMVPITPPQKIQKKKVQLVRHVKDKPKK